jgi:hypothetical protein
LLAAIAISNRVRGMTGSFISRAAKSLPISTRSSEMDAEQRRSADGYGRPRDGDRYGRRPARNRTRDAPVGLRNGTPRAWSTMIAQAEASATDIGGPQGKIRGSTPSKANLPRQRVSHRRLRCTLVGTMLILKRRHKVPSYSMHDGLLVPQLKWDLATDILKTEYHRVIGVEPMITVDPEPETFDARYL